MGLYEASGCKLNRELCTTVEEKYPDASLIFENNPYELLYLIDDNQDYFFSFLDIDPLVILYSFDMRLKEMKEALIYILKQNEEQGNSWISYEELSTRLKQLLNYTGHPLLKGSISAYLNYYNNIFYYDKKNNKIALERTRRKEWEVYYNVKHLKQATNKFRTFTPINILNILSDEQLKAAQEVVVCDGNISILKGGPGSGKTTTLKSIVLGFNEQYPKDDIVLLAPTGKATRRIKQVFGSYDIEISTIALFVGYKRELTKYEKSNIKATSVIIIDEASMVDLGNLHKLLSLMDLNHTKLILVGDSEQLPAIGVGNFLEDFPKMGVFTKELTKNYRSDNSVAENAKKMRDNNPFMITDDTFEFIDCPKSLIKYIIGLRQNSTILTPYQNELRTGNTKELNNIIQNQKNSSSGCIDNFKIGDKVILIHTNYQEKYYNGDTGTIIGYDTSADGIIVKLDDSDKEVVVKDRTEIELRYAITIHKSQGSEYPEVDIVIPEFSPFISKKMIYTAITRAQLKVRLWTTKEIFRKIMFTPEIKRKSFISEWAAA